jgi:type II secretory pathway component GspD/PulD (secretin)
MALKLIVFGTASLFLLVPVLDRPLMAQEPVGIEVTDDGIAVEFVNADLRAVLQALGTYLERPLLFGDLPPARVTLVSPGPLPQGALLPLLRSLLANQGFELVEADGVFEVRVPNRPDVGPAEVLPGEPHQLFTLRLRHARAADVAATVSALYGQASAFGEIGERRGSLNEQLRQSRISAYDEPTVSPSRGGFGIAVPRLSGETAIVPDPRTNSLLIRGSLADFELIRHAVDQIDVRPLQVLIEATVAFVSREFQLDYGLSAAFQNHAVPGTTDTRLNGSTNGASVADLILHAVNVGGLDLDVVLRAGERRGNVTIVSKPLLLSANNEEAEIVVGDQIPFVQIVEGTSGGVLRQIVQYQDVATSLRILPTISADGYVMLEVMQQVNSVSGAGTINNPPPISTRTLRTNMLVRDGQTAVLGGLTSVERDRASSGVPFLSAIPIIGGFFGSKHRRNRNSELYVFLKPRVISSDSDLDAASNGVRGDSRGMLKLRSLMKPLTPDSIPD